MQLEAGGTSMEHSGFLLQILLLYGQDAKQDDQSTKSILLWGLVVSVIFQQSIIGKIDTAAPMHVDRRHQGR